ncbi:hypothetical protein CHLRE_07g343050v5 [Chlamydomonas reinhardtii]|uniref:Uncharacterized protein n=1 Tax=Chlamydomonas reinhardtii TaxID=3055 RepID=A8ITR6_CHLRE|nr:uncharacterized protein CHLRE_07g343050v5 [Chlamydomonas reinhardtii]PNW81112.1 hypothetical protein CHLRE_07g343050v5 [Chlamydomonas reinhardtii]|eukprot:XP_001692419.1 predicted protein [Chlamydomonas reinhardtii]
MAEPASAPAPRGEIAPTLIASAIDSTPAAPSIHKAEQTVAEGFTKGVDAVEEGLEKGISAIVTGVDSVASKIGSGLEKAAGTVGIKPHIH